MGKKKKKKEKGRWQGLNFRGQKLFLSLYELGSNFFPLKKEKKRKERGKETVFITSLQKCLLPLLCRQGRELAVT